MRDLAPNKIRRSRDPDVVGALVVEHPPDDLSAFRGGKLRRKWRAHYLLDSKALGKDKDGSVQQKYEKERFEGLQVLSEYQRFRNFA